MVRCTLQTRRAGEFTSQIHVYLDDGALREIVIIVRGEVLAKGGEKKEPKKTVLPEQE